MNAITLCLCLVVRVNDQSLQVQVIWSYMQSYRISICVPLLCNHSLNTHQCTLPFFWVGKLDSGKLWIWLHLLHHGYELWKVEYFKCPHNSCSPYPMHWRECELQAGVTVL